MNVFIVSKSQHKKEITLHFLDAYFKPLMHSEIASIIIFNFSLDRTLACNSRTTPELYLDGFFYTNPAMSLKSHLQPYLNYLCQIQICL